MQLSCEHCLWWQQETSGVLVQGTNSVEHGRCHRFPPPRGEFPLLHRTAFCGEFTPRTYASVARLAGGMQVPSPNVSPEQERKSIEASMPSSPTGEVLSGETAAIIAAAVAMMLPGPHRIISAQPVAPAPFGPWPLGAVLNTWAVEGRVQHFSSHRLR